MITRLRPLVCLVVALALPITAASEDRVADEVYSLLDHHFSEAARKHRNERLASGAIVLVVGGAVTTAGLLLAANEPNAYMASIWEAAAAVGGAVAAVGVPILAIPGKVERRYKVFTQTAHDTDATTATAIRRGEDDFEDLAGEMKIQRIVFAGVDIALGAASLVAGTSRSLGYGDAALTLAAGIVGMLLPSYVEREWARYEDNLEELKAEAQ